MRRIPGGDPQRESPGLLEQDGASGGIEDLQKRVDRYGSAKATALDIAQYMRDRTEHQVMASKVSRCGEYLLFRHYYTIDEVRLHAASLCRKHLLCPLCAIRRGAKSLKAYLDRFEVVRAARGDLDPFLVTLTVKDGADLRERFEHLRKSQRELWMRKHRGRGSVLDGVDGAVWSYEFKRGSGSGLWHPHLHMIALATTRPDQEALSAEWREITGDSWVVDVRPIDQEDLAGGFIEVFKYATKFQDQDPADVVHGWETLRGRRLLGSAGCFRGVKVPESLLDELLDLPYASLFFRYLPGGYSRCPQK